MAAGSVIQSKHEQVHRIVADRIADGGYALGQLLPSEAQIGQELGVSRVTVRRALTTLVKDGLIESKQGVGHVVRAKRTRPRVGIVYGNTDYRPEEPGSYRRMLYALTRSLAKHRFTSQLFCVRPYESGMSSDRDELLSALRRNMLNVVIMVAWPCPPEEDRHRAREDEEILQLIREHRTPLTGLSHMQQPGSFAVDYRAVGEMGACHFLEEGRRRIAVIAGGDTIVDQGEVIDGYHQAMNDAGASVNPDWIVRTTELTRVAGYVAMRRLLRLRPRPQAVVIGDDVVACGVMTAVLEQGVDVPGDLELASFFMTGCDMVFPKPFVQLQIDFDHVIDSVVQRVVSGESNENVTLFQPRLEAVDSSVQQISGGRALIVGA